MRFWNAAGASEYLDEQVAEVERELTQQLKEDELSQRHSNVKVACALANGVAKGIGRLSLMKHYPARHSEVARPPDGYKLIYLR